MRFTDDERRAVAARLREKHRERTSPLLMEPQDVDMQAFGYLRDLASCVPDGKSLFAVLADLVEPSCDRGALLALADALDPVRPDPDCAACPLRGHCESEDVGCSDCKARYSADAIREACGEAGR